MNHQHSLTKLHFAVSSAGESESFSLHSPVYATSKKIRIEIVGNLRRYANQILYVPLELFTSYKK